MFTSGYTFELPTTDKYRDLVVFPEAFTRDEVERILAMGEGLSDQEGRVGSDNRSNVEQRRSTLRWIGQQPGSVWLFERLAELATSCNQERYRFDLWGLGELLQLTRYDEGQFYDWHKDHGAGRMSIRKLSIMIQLAEAEEYGGGDVEFLFGRDPERAPRALGSAVVFPSFVLHRVTPVTRGARRSLVAWVSGPPFR